MESRKSLWIFVAVVLVAMCCCLAALVVVAGGWFFDFPFRLGQGAGWGEERMEETYEVGGSPSLEVDNFAGSVTVRAGERGEVRVVAVKKAQLGGNLDRIQIEIRERDGGLEIRTRKSGTLSSASVQLEITTPVDTSADLHTGAGSLDVQGLDGDVRLDTGAGSVTAQDLGSEVWIHTGSGAVDVRDVRGDLTVDTGAGGIDIETAASEIDAHTGSGGIDVRGASGPVSLDTGSGSIDYEGEPWRDCRFKTGTGGITLRLPADLSAEVDLHTGVGSIELDFAVDGEVSRRDVKGVIGSGEGASIYARTGSGSIDLIRR